MWNGKSTKQQNTAADFGSEMETDIQCIVDSVIGEEYLINATGESDLSTVEFLDIVIDTQVQSVFELCDFLPQLKSLVLDHSSISSVRDLGTGLRSITSLSLCACGLHDIDGIGVLSGLKQLFLNGNHISDISPLALHDNLEVLKIEDNNLTDISAADDLSSCVSLTHLHISGNPLERAPNVRLIIASIITSLLEIDGCKVDPAAHSKVTNAMILEAASAMRLIQEEIDDERRLVNNTMEIGRSTPNGNNNSNNHRSVSSSMGSNKGGNNNKNGVVSGGGAFPDTGSELTHGSSVVLAGNMAAAMRKRRNQLVVAADGNSSTAASGLSLKTGATTMGPLSASSTSGKNSVLHSLVIDDPESTLGVLDSALLSANSRITAPNSMSSIMGGPKSASSPSPYLFTQFLKEGDITAQASGTEKLFKPVVKGGVKGKGRQTACSDDDDEDDGDEVPAYTSYWEEEDEEDEDGGGGRTHRGSPRRSVPVQSQQQPQSKMPRNQQQQAAQTLAQSQTQRPSSSKQQRPKTPSAATTEHSLSINNSLNREKLFAAANGSAAGQGQGSADRSPRPRPQSGSANRNKKNVALSTGAAAAVPSLDIGKSVVESSPRGATSNSSRPQSQQLSSRPQSTQSNASFASNSSFFGSERDSSRPGTGNDESLSQHQKEQIATYSAPFKIDADDDEVLRLKTQMKTLSVKASGARLGSSSDMDCAARDREAGCNEEMRYEGGGGGKGGVGNSHNRFIQQPSSIVHQDMVIRRKGSIDERAAYSAGGIASAADAFDDYAQEQKLPAENLALARKTIDNEKRSGSANSIDDKNNIRISFPSGHNKRPSSGHSNSNGIIDNDNNHQQDDDEEDEDIAVDHASRHSLMGSSTSRNNKVFSNNIGDANGAVAGSSNSVGDGGAANVLSPARGSKCDQQSLSSVNAEYNQQHQYKHQHPSISSSSASSSSSSAATLFHRTNNMAGTMADGDGTVATVLNNVNNVPTQSSVAGMSLGFNLEGSLAAIEKWVQDMGSSDEDDEDDGDNGNDTKPFNSSHAGAGRRGSNTLQDKWRAASPISAGAAGGAAGVGNKTEEEAVNVIGSPNSRTGSVLSVSSSKDKILKRSAIYDMCSNSGQPQQQLQIQQRINSRGSTPPTSAGSFHRQQQRREQRDCEGLTGTSPRINNSSNDNNIGSSGHKNSNSISNNNQQHHDRIRHRNRRSSNGDDSGSSEDDEPVDTRPNTGTSSNGSASDNGSGSMILRQRRCFDESVSAPPSTKSSFDDGGPVAAGATTPSSAAATGGGAGRERGREVVVMMTTAVAAAAANKSIGKTLVKVAQPPFVAAATPPSLSTAAAIVKSTPGLVQDATQQNDGSPARFTAECEVTKAAVSSSSSNSKGNNDTKGKAVDLPDEELVDLLRKPPKTTLILRTKGNFQDFFRGIAAPRMRALLELAYADMDADEAGKREKVNKRMDLLTGVFA